MAAFKVRGRWQRPSHGRPNDQKNQRLDIQGLRMVAVMTVFAFHLCGWPSGGFVGVDVFFVISGFLITGNLLRMTERSGNVSFRQFYINRIRRIMPAATAVLVITYAVSLMIFVPFRSHQVGIDALFAFLFMSNWWFVSQATDYFAAQETLSPVQHYWSLSIEEQFYFVWPALIFAVTVAALKMGLGSRKIIFTGYLTAFLIAASFTWAIYETSTAATWAYFDTFARAWELGVGALLATANALLARIPDGLKPFLSWTGLFLIAGSLFVVSEDSIGFPAPWALMPVVGASLVIMAGVQGEPRYQGFLRNRVSVYIGNISYSLYLVHWPVIVFLTVLMPAGGYYYYAIAVTLTFGLSIASYHFVEAPFRHRGSPGIIRRLRAGRDRDVEMEGSAQYAALAALALVTVSVLAFSVQPPVAPSVPPVMTSPVVNRADAVAPVWGPLTAGLQEEIEQALQASEWPPLEPSVESVVTSKYFPDLESCNGNEDPQRCTWGEPTAATRVLLAGDSIAMTYAEPLRRLALNSSGRIQVTLQTLAACRLVNFYPLGDGPQADQQSMDACEIRKQQTIDLINTTKPSIVIISNAYNDRTHDRGGSSGWYDYRREMIDRFKESTGKIVLLSAPPEDRSISECFSTARSVPADCISRVTPRWHAIADVERRVAASVGGVWVDSRPWFCSTSELCPAFVGSLLTKRDRPHMSMAYAQKITPVIEESLRQAGVL